MSQSDSLLEDEFHSAMIEIYRLAVEECDYRPKAFLAMVVEKGGLETAKKLLSTTEIQSGLYELVECDRLDLTVESLVVRPKYQDLFTAEEIAEAHRRLDMLSGKSP